MAIGRKADRLRLLSRKRRQLLDLADETDLNGQNRQTVVQSTPFQGDYNVAAYSPDGTRLVYERHNSGFSSPQFKSALFVVDVATGVQRQITSWDLDAGDNPDWSPDGKWIVFRTHVNTDEGCQIDVIHPDGTQITLGTDNGLGTNPDVYVINVDGSDLHAIETNPLWDSATDWESLR